jgi:hypothetical protein
MLYLLVFSSGFYSMLLYVKIECLYLYQIAIGTDDVYKSAEAVKQCGGKIIREPGPIPVINTKITACLDPDGWKSVCFLYFLFIFCYHGSLTVSISISHYSFLYLKGHLVFTFLVICCFGQIRSFLKIGICDYMIGKCRRKMPFFFQENLGLLKPRKVVQKFLCACAL